MVAAKKGALICYFKPPVVTFGLVFPLFFFLAYAVGGPVPLASLVTSVLAVALCFSASAVGPLITPWERRALTVVRPGGHVCGAELILREAVIKPGHFTEAQWFA